MQIKRYEAIVIGASAGGMDAISAILPSFNANYPLPIFITQHQSESSPNDGFIEKYYNGLCQLPVKEARHGELIKPGIVYLSVPSYHLQVETNKTISLSADLPVKYAIPSIDVLFETAVEAYRSKLVGVILTGASDDGAQGLHSIKKHGGLTVVQTPESAIAKIMPTSALSVVNADHILPLSKIGPFLAALNKACV